LTDSRAATPLIIGEADDEHARAVTSRLAAAGADAVLVDAAALGDGTAEIPPWTAGDDARARPRRRGWIRRLAPPGWRGTAEIDSHEAVVRAAWAALLFGTLLTEPCDWLTTLPALLTAENKLFQLSVAESCGIRVPRTIVATTVRQLADFGLPSAVVKPLGPAAYVDDDQTDRVVAAQRADVASLNDQLLAGAPFLFQEEIRARAHLRIVTVEATAWAARLTADGLPLDWRFEDAAHESFVPAPRTTAEVKTAAIALAQAARVGYSSQDWIETVDGEFVFLDLNPAGQWLFLPGSVAEAVTHAIALHLCPTMPTRESTKRR
jgi:hypothetical protein